MVHQIANGFDSIDEPTEELDVRVDKIHEKRMSSMSRRRLMNALVGMGATVGTAAHLTPEDVEAASSDEIPIAWGHTFEEPGDPTTERVTEKRHVDADWYNDLKTTQRVREHLALEELPEVVAVDAIPPEFGGENGYVRAAVSEVVAEEEGTSAADIAGEIPETVNGVEVEVETIEGPLETPDVPESEPSEEIEADDVESEAVDYESGRAIYHEDSGYCTLTGRVFFDGSSLARFITVHHLWHGEDPIENDVKMYSAAGNAIGEAFTGDCTSDYIVFFPEDGYEPDNEVIVEGVEITGEYTQDAVNAMAGNDVVVEKYGQRTGHTSGEVHTANGYVAYVGGEGCDDRDDQVRWGSGDDFNDGDSGSLTYYQWGDDPDETWAICVAAGTYPGTSTWDYEVFGSGSWHFDSYVFG